jgi:hypothetical protein
MNKRLTDEELLVDYCRVMEYQLPKKENSLWNDIMLTMIGRCRQDEPRINCGTHLIDYMNICDEDDDMDSFYGEDYPW